MIESNSNKPPFAPAIFSLEISAVPTNPLPEFRVQIDIMDKTNPNVELLVHQIQTASGATEEAPKLLADAMQRTACFLEGIILGQGR